MSPSRLVLVGMLVALLLVAACNMLQADPVPLKATCTYRCWHKYNTEIEDCVRKAVWTLHPRGVPQENVLQALRADCRVYVGTAMLNSCLVRPCGGSWATGLPIGMASGGPNTNVG